MASDYFLKIDGIDGESHDAKHKGEIDIQSFSLGVTQPHTAPGGGGAGAGKASFQDIHFTKAHDKSSPLVFLKCAGGDHIPKVVLTARKAGTDQQEYLKWVLEDCFISSFQAGGHGSADVSDQFSIAYSKIDHEYKEQKPDGTLGGSVKHGWDVKANKKK
jgi:type VI secretion system secreted protein Hcp